MALHTVPGLASSMRRSSLWFLVLQTLISPLEHVAKTSEYPFGKAICLMVWECPEEKYSTLFNGSECLTLYTVPRVDTINMLILVYVSAHTPPGTLASSSIFIDLRLTFTTEPSPAPSISSLADYTIIVEMPPVKILFRGPTLLKLALSR